MHCLQNMNKSQNQTVYLALFTGMKCIYKPFLDFFINQNDSFPYVSYTSKSESPTLSYT